MDVAKYIGLFLLKNNVCYIHGLGNLELVKKPAHYDGHNLVPATYEVVVAPSNSIDDSLSNFIATNEQISISKATTALKDFSTRAKIELAQGKEVAIPSLGSFSEINGRLLFNTLPYLQQSGTPIAATKGMPKRPAEERKEMPVRQQPTESSMQQPAIPAPVSSPYEYPEPPAAKSLNWGRIALFVLIALAIVAGVIFALRNMFKPTGKYAETAPHIEVPAPDTVASQMPVDSSVMMDNATGLVSFKLILNTYETRKKAEKRFNQLTRIGNTVELKAEDSSTFFILMAVQAPPADTAHVIDSLRGLFNPEGVYIY